MMLSITAVCKKQSVLRMRNRSQNGTLEQWARIFEGPEGANRRPDLILLLIKKGECVPDLCAWLKKGRISARLYKK